MPIRKEVHTFDKFIDIVIEAEPCKRHRSETGIACWHILRSDGTGLAAICNWRAKKAGFNGKIDQKSIRNKS